MNVVIKSPVRTAPGVLKSKPSRRNKRMLNNIGLFVLIAIFGFIYAVILGSASAMGSHAAVDFIRKAAVGNEFEIESSKLALQKSQNDNIQHFAQQMVDDHGKAGEDLTATAAKANLGAPNMALDHKHQRMLDKLNAATGTEFDRLYLKEQVKAHDEAVSLFKDYSQHGDNDAMKSFASNTLPTLQEHQEKVTQMKASY